MRIVWITLLCLGSSLFAEGGGIHVDLRNPTYKDGALYTNQGGVVRSESQNLRIQARTIRYVRKGSAHTLEAKGDLLVQYKGRAYVGSRFEYDLNTNTGVMYNGKTCISSWFAGGDEIRLNADGSYTIDNATLTTCENQDSSWDINARSMKVVRGDMLSASNIRFRLFKVPTFWLPAFKLSLKKFKSEPVFKYELRWDSGLGPRISTRYELYSWNHFALYGRLEYRWKTGWGGAIETDYHPQDCNLYFVTRNYLAKDRLVTATEKMQRYRLQGDFKFQSQNERTLTLACWDKYSDVRMPNDFKSTDFEINQSKITLFYARQREDEFLSSFTLRPRANPFQSMKQDLPSLYVTTRPLEIGKGLFSLSTLKASYLNFVYSTQLSQSLASYHSPRIEVRERIFRPFYAGSFTFTPYIGGIGIFYGTSPSSNMKWLGVVSYGARAEARCIRHFERYKHQIQPYAEITGLSNPTVGPDSHYIFSIQDGYDRLDQFRIGTRNLLYSTGKKGEPFFIADVYANAFFQDRKMHTFLPYGYVDLIWRLPSLHITSENGWNFRNQVLQFSNARIQWTVNENVAISLEGRYRSRFDWRKADHDNFILDVSRSESQLLASPLSDQRVTFLTDLFIRFNPFWECRIQSHHGFLRLNEKPYNEIKIDLYTWITSCLKARLSFCHSADRGINSVYGEVYLVKNR